jgi:hypothetical protein
MPETPLPRKAIMPNNHHLMKKNCLRFRVLEIKLRHFDALFPFLSISGKSDISAESGD